MKDNNNNLYSPLESFNPDEDLKMDFTRNKFNFKDDDLTDSDVDDPKYMPTSFSNNNFKLNPNIINTDNIKEINNDDIQNENNPNLNYRNNIEKRDLNNEEPKNSLKITELMQLCRNLENENSMLKNTLDKYQEDLKVKNNIICEFESLFQLSQNKFNKYEETNNLLKAENDRLKSHLNNFETEMKDVKLKSKKNEDNLKNNAMFENHFNEIQDDFSKKEKELTQNFKEKETKMKNTLNNEIAELNKKLDEFRVLNEKLKFELSNQKIENENLESKIEENNFEHESEKKKLEKENQKNKELIKEYEKKILELEQLLKSKSIDYENEINDLKIENSNIQNELNIHKEKLIESQGQILNQNHDLEILSFESQQNKLNLSNKDALIDQLKNQIEELQKELNEKENEIQNHLNNKDDDQNEFEKKINELMKEKIELESEKAELTQNLAIATESLKKMKNFITEKYGNMEQNLIKESKKNESLEKKYKNIIRQMKTNEKKLYQENQNLKNKINQSENEKSEMELNFQNRVQNMSLFNSINNNQNNRSLMNNNSFSPNRLNINNKLNQSNINSNINNPPRVNNSVNYNMKPVNSPCSPCKNINQNNISTHNSYMMTNMNSYNMMMSPSRNINLMNYQRFQDPKEKGQKKTLEEFKKLLLKIDEKLDNPNVNDCENH